VFDQTAPEVLAEVRQLAWQGFQRRDEPLELSPADAALPDFRRKGVPLCQEDSNHRISGGCKVFTLQDNSHVCCTKYGQGYASRPSENTNERKA
jgi:hypothetical protein